MRYLWLIFLLPFLAVIGWAGYERIRDPYQVGPLIASPVSSPEWLAVADKVMARLTHGTNFERNWSINREPLAGVLSLILFDSRTDAQVRTEFRQNCTFVSGQTLIVCDIALFDQFLRQRALDKTAAPFSGDRPVDAPVTLIDLSVIELSQIRFQLASWILGHELGHILNGDTGGAFESRLDDLTGPDSPQQARELAADASLVDRFPDPNNSDMDFYRFLVGVLQVEINSKACPNVPPGQLCPNIRYGAGILEPADKLPFASCASHPEYLIRLLRLLAIADQKHDLGLIGYLNRQMIENFIMKRNGCPT